MQFIRVFGIGSLLTVGIGFCVAAQTADDSGKGRLSPEVTLPNGGIRSDRVWSGHRVRFALLTERGHQFIAYDDAERRTTVAGRQLGETNWTCVKPEGVLVPERKRLSSVTGWDMHNYLTRALDRDGCLHFSGNMHAEGTTAMVHLPGEVQPRETKPGRHRFNCQVNKARTGN